MQAELGTDCIQSTQQGCNYLHRALAMAPGRTLRTRLFAVARVHGEVWQPPPPACGERNI